MRTEFKNSVAYLITMPKGMLRRSPEEIKAWREKEERKSKRKLQRKTVLPVYLVLLMIPFCSCLTQKACERKFPNLENDSVSVVSNSLTVIRDTTVYVKIPGDTVFASMPASEMSTLIAGTSTSTAIVKNGMLEHRLVQKDTAVAATLIGAIRTTRNDLIRKQVVYQVKYVNRLSKWQWLQVWMGRVFLGLVLLLIPLRCFGNVRF